MICYTKLHPCNAFLFSNCKYFQQKISKYCVFDRFPADTIYGQARKQRGAKRGRRGAGEGPYRERVRQRLLSPESFPRPRRPLWLTAAHTNPIDLPQLTNLRNSSSQPLRFQISQLLESWISLAQNNHISW